MNMHSNKTTNIMLTLKTCKIYKGRYKYNFEQNKATTTSKPLYKYKQLIPQNQPIIHARIQVAKSIVVHIASLFVEVFSLNVTRSAPGDSG